MPDYNLPAPDTDLDLPNDITDGMAWYEPAPALPADADDAGDDQTIYTDWLYRPEGAA